MPPDVTDTLRPVWLSEESSGMLRAFSYSMQAHGYAVIGRKVFRKGVRNVILRRSGGDTVQATRV